MTYEQLAALCKALPGTTYVTQWGGSHVWKVGGKVFVVGGWEVDQPAFTFKVSEVDFFRLRDLPGLRPAPYLASRGMKWIQHFAEPGLRDPELRASIERSYRIVARGLTKAARAKLGLA